METFSGYQLLEKLDETATSLVYRAIQESSGRRVIVKMLNTDNPSPSEIARFNREFELIRDIDDDAVIKVYDVISSDGKVALVLEDFDGVSLKKIATRAILPLETFLKIGITIARVLDKLHKKNIIHKDIKPHNILFNENTGALKLTDFGISAELTHARDNITQAALVDGTLAYMAPEQTGRMNRSVGYETDLYSLGVTFYELLTQRLPFDDVTDPVEYFHAHMARRPVPPAELNSSLPPVLSDIVMKLMAKESADRYQSGLGLMADLQECLDQLRRKGRIDRFEIAARDIGATLKIPQKLFGREKEGERLRSAYRRVEGGACVVFLVSGDAGTGKTVFMAENRRHMEAKNGLIISGRFEAQNKTIPYSGFIFAFQELLNQLLVESAERMAAWKSNLQAALGSNGKLLTDMVPEIEILIGKQPEVPALDAEEARNRFNYAVRNFIRVFARKSHPLTILLDDLHQADAASLDLLKFLAGDADTGYLFIVGTYRRDAAELSRLQQTLAEIAERGIVPETIMLTPLEVPQVNALISAALKLGRREAQPLAELVCRKTNGTPFFVHQFLGMIYKTNLLRLSEDGTWCWDAQKIGQLAITDNVVELMAEKIARLDDQIRETLQMCACVGTRFDLETVAPLLDRPFESLLDDITVAFFEELIREDGDGYRFQHEKIREAAYSLIPDKDKPHIHLKIGQFLLERARADDEGLRDKVFHVVRHWNAAAPVITDAAGRLELARMNILAGEKARGATAYDSAENFFSLAAAYLPPDAWEKQPDLCRRLYLLLGESRFLIGDTDGADGIFADVLARIESPVERADIYSLMVTLYTAVDKPDRALAVGLQALSLLGVRLPEHPRKIHVLINIIRVRLAQGRNRVEDLLHLPELTDPKQNAIMSLLAMIGAPAYYVNPNLFAIIITRGVIMSLQKGLPGLAAYGMIAVGLIMGSRLGFYDYGNRLGKVGLEVMKRFHDVKSFARSYFIYAYFILPWREPARGCLHYLALAYKHGLETGDIIFTGHSINVSAAYRLFTGFPLDAIFEDHKGRSAFLERLDSPFILNNYLDTYEMVTQLRGGGEADGESLQTRWDDREQRLKAIEDENLQLGMFIHFAKREMLLFFFGKYRECYDMGCRADRIIDYAMGTMYVAEHYFYWGLSAARLCLEDATADRRLLLRTIRTALKKYAKWARGCPENFAHKHWLLKAELARLRGKKTAAAGGYHQALVQARQNNYIHTEGLVGELAADFYFSVGYDEIGRAYITEARNAFHRWGADAKVKRLEQLYPHVGSMAQVRSRASETSSTITGSVIDLSTLQKALKTIAEEKVHTRMLEKIIRTSVEFAGAQKGLLILRKEHAGDQDSGAAADVCAGLFVEAEWSVDAQEVKILQSTPVGDKDNLSQVALNYVARTRKSVVVHNAQTPHEILPRLQSEAHIRTAGVKSLMCMPILISAVDTPELIGVLYFENNLTSHAFTQERIETLEIISLSAAGRLELSRKAVTDGLTGLYNHDYFYNILQQELLLAKRKGRELSVMMIDIDHFKQFNDKWGHQAGDLVLKEVSAAIKSNCRGSDVVARYGGEEFVLLLHETDPSSAMVLAEHLRQTVDDLVVTDPGQISLHVTISVGVAGFPHHARDKKTLIKRADEAMYVSKEKGRNRVTLAA
ncbi:MAG: diguanylate cyclase [Thermodesulfobacteriota bacterium]